MLHPTYPYIVFNDLPKVDNLKRLFADRISRHAGYRDGVEQAEPVARGESFGISHCNKRRSWPRTGASASARDL